MSLSNAFSLFGVMLVLAALPSSSVLIVITRSTAFGFVHGVLAALGIVTGDILFILIAVLGLSYLDSSLGDLFVLVKYIGAGYLFWLALTMWKAKVSAERPENDVRASWSSSYLGGLLFTLADQKAIFFYLGLLPAFINLSLVNVSDIGVIICITIIAVGGVKISYAFLATQAAALFSDSAQLVMNRFAAGLMMLIAGYIIVSA